MKFSVILSNLGACTDRYVSGGYAPQVDIKEQFSRLSQLTGVDGVELVGNWHVTKENIPFIKQECNQLKLPIISIIPDHFGSAKWGKGAFTSPDVAVREMAIDETVQMCQCARELNCKTVSIWNGQDGYDYPMQVNYIQTNNWLIEGVKKAAQQFPDINISLEYKPKEPRTHCFLPNIYSVLFLSEQINEKNVGITMDFGHALEAYENCAESACLAQKNNRLMHVHINDNYRMWDDDMITGSIHTIEYIELFYWLIKLGYDGYISIDQYPYRENAMQAAQESINWMKAFEKAARRIDEDKMSKILSGHDAVASTKYLREIIFG